MAMKNEDIETNFHSKSTLKVKTIKRENTDIVKTIRIISDGKNKIEDYEPPTKQFKAASDVKNNAMKMMKNMGYTEGSGLGSKGQGRTEPIVAISKSNRHGIGVTDEILGVQNPDTVWKKGDDEAFADGDIIANFSGKRTSFDEFDFDSLIMVGDKKKSMENESTFCDEYLLHEMLKCKSVLNKYTEFFDARSRSNPYEKIGRGIFMNRAAMKMVNMDYVMDSLFTETKDKDILFFADICAGPGGFSEYMLWKLPMKSCGFGFTLRGKNDFVLKDFVCGPSSFFHPSYGKDGDGDITKEHNLERFRQEVMDGTSQLGVHTVLADGGFSVEGQESMQEVISKQIYLCQFLCAINILRINGNFLCKLFDTFTDFSVGLIHLMSTLFSEFSIIKPITSRPANSERYIIFKSFTDQVDRVESIRQFFYQINRKLNELKDMNENKTKDDDNKDKHSSDNESDDDNDKDKDCGQDVLRIIPQSFLKKDVQFFHFIKDVNNRILKQQITALLKLHAFIENKNLSDDRQIDIRNEVIARWGLENLKREQFITEQASPVVRNLVKVGLNNHFSELYEPSKKGISQLDESEFKKDKFVIRNHYAGFISVSDFPKSLYVVTRDKRSTSVYEDQGASRPMKLTDKHKKWSLFLPSFTILLVHFNEEYIGKKANRKHNSVVVVDAALIYGEDITSLPYTDRMAKVAHLCLLMDPKRKGDIKPLDFFPLHILRNFLAENQQVRDMKNHKQSVSITCRLNDSFFVPGKLIIINAVQDPWMIAVSRSSGHTYYYNVRNHQSIFEVPDDLYTSYSKSNIYEVDWCGEDNQNFNQNFLALFNKKSM